MARDEKARKSDAETSLLDRRNYLKLAGAAAASVATFGAGSATAQSDEMLLSENFEQSNYAQNFTSAWRQGTNDSLSTSVYDQGSSSLEVNFPQGSHYGMTATVDPVEAGLVSSELDELYSCFWVQFPSNYDGGSDGSKLPGPVNLEPQGGHAGTPSDGRNGWSARASYVDNGSSGIDLSYYVYHMDMNGGYGDYFDATTVPRGEWVKVEQYIKLNTTSGGSANRDGQLKMWVNDALEVDRSGLRFTLEPERGVNFRFAAYYGGNETSPQNQSLFFDRWMLNQTRPSDSSSGSGTGQSGDQTDDQTGDENQQGTLLELVSGENTTDPTYEFTVEGSVAKRSTNPDTGYISESDDTVTDNGDGTMTVTGSEGLGYGDAFFVDGTFTSMVLDESEWTIRYGGEEVTVADLANDSSNGSTDDGSDDTSNDNSGDSTDDGSDGSGSSQLPNVIVVDGSNHPLRMSHYEFTVSGDIEKDGEHGSINAFDSVSDNTAKGRIVAGKDAFRFSGSLTGFRVDGPATFHIENNEN